MKTRTLTPLILALLCSWLCINQAAAQPAAKPKPLRVLFIGNSYTSVNNLPGMIQALATMSRQPRSFEFVAVTPGGWSLQRHVDEQNSQAPKKIAEGEWDFVVIQEQSQMPFMYPKTTLDYGSKLGELIKTHKSRPLLYETWSRENQPEHQATITKTYADLAKLIDAPIAPVGQAWEAARKSSDKLKLYNADKSHPSAAGTYLAACVFYAVLYEKSPVGLPGNVMAGPPGKQKPLAQISKEDAALLQKIAWETVQKK